MNIAEDRRLHYYYKLAMLKYILLGTFTVTIIIGAYLVWRVATEQVWEAPSLISEIDYYPVEEEEIEYGASTVDELDYYHDLAELEERSMAMLMELQEPTEEWYTTYKDMNALYEDVGQPDEITDLHSVSELEEMYWVVENETRGASFEAKVNVANVILNRVDHHKFGNTIHSVVTQPSQFSYHPTNVTQETIDACAYASAFEDTTYGALFFQRSAKPPKGLAWIMSDNAGHNFFTYQEEYKEPTEEAPVVVEEPSEPIAIDADIITPEDEEYEELIEEAVG